MLTESPHFGVIETESANDDVYTVGKSAMSRCCANSTVDVADIT